MKIKKEIVEISAGQSFRIFHPRLKNYFFWHYHPEFELVYVEATTGIRHVGQHISSFMESDLVFIGSNIPHLNFDYGIKTSYHQTVVQLKENFLADALFQTPEFLSIQKLFDKAYMGLSFFGETKKAVSGKLENMQRLGNFERLISLIEVLQILADSEEVVKLNEQDTSIKLFLNDKIRMGAIYKYIHANYSSTTNVNEVAASVHLSTAAFCRYFKKQTKMTFTEFVNQYKITQAKTFLLEEKNISEVSSQCGFQSLSYFNKLFKKVAGENPSAFKKRYSKSEKLFFE